jgi:hypothetical protein
MPFGSEDRHDVRDDRRSDDHVGDVESLGTQMRVLIMVDATIAVFQVAFSPLMSSGRFAHSFLNLRFPPNGPPQWGHLRT